MVKGKNMKVIVLYGNKIHCAVTNFHTVDFLGKFCKFVFLNQVVSSSSAAYLAKCNVTTHGLKVSF